MGTHVSTSPNAARDTPRTPGFLWTRLADRWSASHLILESAICWVSLIVAVTSDWLGIGTPALILGLYVISYVAGGATATIRALRDLAHLKVNIDLLMVLAAIGAATIDAWMEGAVLFGLFSASNALQAFALGKTTEAVESLIKLSPLEATVVAADRTEVVPVQQLTLDDVILVRAGERIAADGTVIAGNTAVDQSIITGESMPVDKAPGSQVFAGSMNGFGPIRVQVGKLAGQNTIERVAELVARAQQEKGRMQRFTDRFEGWYALAVILFSALVAVIPMIFLQRSFDTSFYRAMALLIVASPCALVISTPAAILSALSNAARHGILIKGGANLEALGDIGIFAFDKTGTLTRGRPQVTDTISFDQRFTSIDILSWAGSIEHVSEHPLARAVVAEARKVSAALVEPTDVRTIPGFGITGKIGDREIAIGNGKLFEHFGRTIPGTILATAHALMSAGKTTMFVGNRDGILGIIAVADVVRPDAQIAIQDLRKRGIHQTVMLTGDNQRVGEAIGHQLGLDRVVATLLPAEKLDVIRTLGKDHGVAMVGDGVNDAPALATATVGIAMGAAGSDVALEAADIVLMSDDLTGLPYALELAQKTRRIVRQNLTFSLAVIVVLVTLTLTIGIPLPLGVVGHEGSTVIVILSGLRLLRTLHRPENQQIPDQPAPLGQSMPASESRLALAEESLNQKVMQG